MHTNADALGYTSLFLGFRTSEPLKRHLIFRITLLSHFLNLGSPFTLTSRHMLLAGQVTRAIWKFNRVS